MLKFSLAKDIYDKPFDSNSQTEGVFTILI